MTTKKAGAQCLRSGCIIIENSYFGDLGTELVSREDSFTETVCQIQGDFE
jgi:hypothetical protein